MAYGKGQPKGTEQRMADLGRSPTTAELAGLRKLVIEACGTMADGIWPDSILDDMPVGRDLDAIMLRAQSSLKGTLNSVWAEKARLTAKSAVLEQVKRARGNLFGRFKHLSTVGEKPLADGARRLVNFPEEWSRRLTQGDIESMQEIADSLDFAGAMQLFRRLEAGQPASGMTGDQREALSAMLLTVKERFARPQWNGADGTVQLHLDFRCLAGGRQAQNSLLERLSQAARQTFGLGETYTAAFLISGMAARGAPLKLTAAIRPEVVQRLLMDVPDGADARFTSLALEIGPTETILKGVLSQRPEPLPLSEVEHLVGGDFGFVNTMAAAMVRLDRPLDAAWLRTVREWTKAQSKAYLESHWHDGEPVKQALFQGRNFLARIDGHASQIDRLRSEIDRVYNRLGRLKREINRILGRPTDTQVDLGTGPTVDTVADRRPADLLGRFARLLAVVTRLKLVRRKIYRAVDGLKKSWFGWITTQLAKLCRENKAAYVREHLTILAKEKKSSEYKGRTFNRMMSNGSKGQFLRRASSKLKWWGIPEIVVPSYYTSSTDVRHAVVDRKQRSGETFTARMDGRRSHADLNAALTLALWPVLRPKATLTAVAAQ